MRQLLRRIHRIMGRTPMGTALAVRLRNQCHAIIAQRLQDGFDAGSNGEAWLAGLVAPSAATFVDVGANVGSWSATLLASMHAPELGLLIEPNSSAVSILRAQFQHSPVVEIVHAAASDCIGKASFYEEPLAGCTSSLIPGVSATSTTERCVSVTTVDAEAARRSIEQVDMLKIDVEGYDLHVLRGALGLLSRHRVGVVQFEYNGAWAYAGSTLAGAMRLLHGLDYKVFLLKASGLYQLDYTRYGEYFSYSNYVALAPNQMPHLQEFVRGLA